MLTHAAIYHYNALAELFFLYGYYREVSRLRKTGMHKKYFAIDEKPNRQEQPAIVLEQPVCRAVLCRALLHANPGGILAGLSSRRHGQRV